MPEASPKPPVLFDSMYKRVLYIVRGLPGAGKSTIARMIAMQEGAGFYEADMYFDTPEGYKFDPQLLPTAHKWCQDAARHDMIMSRRAIVVANTCVRPWEMEPYIKMASEYRYHVQVVTVQAYGADAADLAERTVHGVPVAAIQNMIEAWRDTGVRSTEGSKA